MTMENRKSVKVFRYILPIVLIFLIVIIIMEHKQDQNNLEQQSKRAVYQLLSCTFLEVEDFDVVATQSSIELSADGEIGLTQDDDKLRDYFQKEFGDFMTDSCIEELAMSRIFYRSIALALKFDSDIEADEIKLTKRSKEQECFDFSAKMKTSAGDFAATSWGTISMEKDGTKWKASKITLNMDENDTDINL